MARRGSRYRKCSLANYIADTPEKKQVVEHVRQYLENFEERFNDGQDVMFIGPTGTGKDHLMTAMLRAAVWRKENVVWRNGFDLFQEFYDSMSGGTEEGVLIKRYTEADVLAISDPIPPKKGLSPYQAGVFFSILDRRYSNERPTWVTINVKDRDEAEEKMGVSTVDRLAENALVLSCDWPSFRKNTNKGEIK